jgi:hypothetical protein
MSENEKNLGGRPRRYTDEDEFAQLTDEYFAAAKQSGEVPSLAGLCLHLGFVDKESFTHYANYGDGFSRTVKRAKMQMENDRIQRLHSGNATGPIFDLKVNHGWQDKQVSEVSGPDGGPVQISAIRLVGVDPEEAE